MPGASPTAIYFGGTFDPPHLGHLAAIRELRQRTGLPVLVVPTGIPGHRSRPEADPLARAEMVELAVAGLFDPEATVCRAEVERPQPSFTADTVERLRLSQPGLVLRLALGSDAAAGLPGWRRVRSLLEQVQLLVYQRAGTAPAGEEVLALLLRLELPLAGAEVISLSAPAIDATGIRERLRTGDRCPDLLPMSVADYIQVHHLYQGGPDPDLVAGAG